MACASSVRRSTQPTQEASARFLALSTLLGMPAVGDNGPNCSAPGMTGVDPLRKFQLDLIHRGLGVVLSRHGA
jgi:hypothetical protein